MSFFHQPYSNGGGVPLGSCTPLTWSTPLSVGANHGHVQRSPVGEYYNQQNRTLNHGEGELGQHRRTPRCAGAGTRWRRSSCWWC